MPPNKYTQLSHEERVIIKNRLNNNLIAGEVDLIHCKNFIKIVSLFLWF